ncbi:MAG: hypothetical protein ACK5Y2_06635 [Bdellovibrionales bacterium]
MTQTHLTQLYQQLLQFGLNPHDWVILPHSGPIYEIQKIDDPDFSFLGRIQNFRWSQVWLKNL